MQDEQLFRLFCLQHLLEFAETEKTGIEVLYPNETVLTEELLDYIQRDVSAFERGLYSSDMLSGLYDYDDVIDDVLAPYGNEEYTRRRTEYIHMQLSRDKDGFIRLHRKLTVAERNKEFQENPFKYGLYRSGGFLHLKPRMANRDSKGFITLTHKQPLKSSEVPIKRDPDGFIRLRRVETKLDRKKKK